VIAATSSSSATITGTKGPDLLRGTKRADLIKGLAGADRLFGDAGDDRLEGGPGPDVLVGGRGRDTIVGGPGNDRIDARDGARDFVSCGTGGDTVRKDAVDTVARNCAPIGSPAPPPPTDARTVILDNEPWRCLGPVDLDLVRVTMRTTVEDAIRLDENCTGRIGRVEVETWTADGIKVQNAGTVAHDLLIESGYVMCHDIAGEYHQDGIHVMGGYRLTFRNLSVDCLGNSNLFLSRGGLGASTPTDIVCDRCVLGPNSGQTLFNADSIRSGARNTTICRGRFRDVRVHPEAQELVDVDNRVLPHDHPSCRDVTGRGAAG
jgi:hypothetical protein